MARTILENIVTQQYKDQTFFSFCEYTNIRFLKFYISRRVVAVNPGSLLNTKMAKEAYGQHWSPAEKGVDILYNLSMTDLAETGKYFDNDKGSFAPAHADSYNKDKITNLLRVTDFILSDHPVKRITE